MVEYCLSSLSISANHFITVFVQIWYIFLILPAFLWYYVETILFHTSSSMQHLHSSIQKQGTTLDLTTILRWILGWLLLAHDFFVSNNEWCHTRFGSRTWYFLGTPGWGAPSHIDQVPIGNLTRSKFFTRFPFEHLRSKNEFRNQSKSFTLPNNKRWYASYDWLTTFCTF